jgi:biopolymer transport protein ExbD
MGGSGSRLAEINVVPLIDILLVLLIIFTVITPLVPRGLDVQVPQPASAEPPPGPEPLVVQLFEDGSLRIIQERVSWGNLEARLAEVFRARAEPVAFLRGDAGVGFADGVRAVDGMRRAGVQRVGLLTPRTEPKPDR